MFKRALKSVLVYTCILLAASHQFAASALSSKSLAPKNIAKSTNSYNKSLISAATEQGNEAATSSKDGFTFKISEDKEYSEKAAKVTDAKTQTVTGSPIGEAEIERLFARLPKLKADTDLSVYIPPKTSIQPPPGKSLEIPFPPLTKLTAPTLAPTAPPLEVLRMSPTGEVASANQISVTFSQPMVPLASQDELAQVPAYVSDVEGEWRWMGTQTMKFVPKSGHFPMSSTFKIKIKGGLKSQAGGVLPADVDFKFNTETIKVTGSSDGWMPKLWSQQVDLRHATYFAFNQKIRPEEMARRISYEWAGHAVKAEPVNIEEAKQITYIKDLVQGAAKDRFIVVRPSTELPKATTIQINVGPGLPSAEGPNLSANRSSFELETYHPLAYQETHTYGHENSLSWQILFNHHLKITDGENIASLIKVEPPLKNMRISHDRSAISVEGAGNVGAKHKITIATGLQDIFGQTLSKPLNLVQVVPHTAPTLLRPRLHFTVLAPGQKLEHVIRTINVKKVHVRLFEVTPADWGTFVDYDHKYPWKKLADKFITPSGKMDKEATTSFNLGSFIKETGGNVVIHVETTETNPKDRKEYALWVQSTTLAVDAFVDHNKALVWVTDLRTGKPIHGASVAFSPKEISPSLTDKDGIVQIDLDKDDAPGVTVQKDNEKAFLPASMWERNGWVKSGQRDTTLWYVASDRNLYRPGEQARFKGWIRRMQNETGGDVVPPSGTSKVKFTAFDGHHSEIAKGEAEVNSLGGFSFGVNLPTQCNTGTARVSVQPAEGTKSESHFAQFRISDFRRPEFELALTDIGSGAHFSGEHTTISARTSYFSGGNLANSDIKWHANAHTAHFTPPGWTHYSFGPTASFFNFHEGWINPIFDVYYSMPPSTTLSEAKNFIGKTNEKGTFFLRTDFGSITPPQPVAIDVSATVHDLTRQQWTSATNILVHPAKHYVGIKIDQDSNKDMHKNRSIHASVIVCDLDGKLVKDSNVEVILQKEELDYSSRKQKYIDLTTQTLTFAGKEMAISIPIETPGRFRLVARIRDTEGRKNETIVNTSVELDIERGPHNALAEFVSLKTDKYEYQSGDKVKIKIQSPFAKASGLMTLRRSGLVTSRSFEMNSTSTTLEVPVLEAYLPNFSIAVELVENNSESITNTFARIANGEIKIDVSKSSRRINIDVQPEAKLLRPGSNSQIEFTMRDRDGNPIKNADAVVAVVDESVLALSGYQFSDPLTALYPTRTAGVSDYHLTPYVLIPAKEYKLGIGKQAVFEFRPRTGRRDLNLLKVEPSVIDENQYTSGLAELRFPTPNSTAGDGSQSLAKLRSNFSALALYEPSARTDDEGRIKLKLKLPDSATRYRIMVAAASGKNFFGYADASITAQLPLTLKPSAPRFLNVGDSFELSVIAQNLTDSPVSARIAVRSNKVDFKGVTGKLIEIPSKGRVEIRFPATAIAVGQARIQVVLDGGKNNDANELTLPIYTPATTETFATYGNYDGEGTIAQPLRLPTTVFPQVGDLQVSTSSTALQTLTDAFIYLYEYPYGCTEQLGSRILAIDALKDMLSAMNPEGLPKADEVARVIAHDVSQIERRQQENGAFGLWDTSYTYTPNPFASVHAAHALERARISGYNVSERVQVMYRAYLRKIIGDIPVDYSKPTEWSIRAYAAYVRSLYEPDKAWDAAQALAKEIKLDEAPLEVIGWLVPVLTIKPSAELTKLRKYLNNQVEETASKASIVRRRSGNQDYLTYWSDSREEAVLLNGMIVDQPNSDLNQKLLKSLIGHRKSGRWDNTQENTFVLMAMRQYFDKYENVRPDFIVRAWLGEDYLGEHEFKGYNADNSNMNVPMSFLSTVNRDNKVVLSKTGKGRLYYRLALNYAPKNLQLKPMDRGFTVQRKYEAVDNKDDVRKLEDGTWRIKAGSRVRVKLVMSTQGLRHHVALVDPLPAGFEPINPELKGNETTPANNDDNENFNHALLWWWSPRWFEHQNLRDERAEAFATTIHEGDYNYSYSARATTPGKFVAAPTKAEEMYTPETFGRGQSDTVVVVAD